MTFEINRTELVWPGKYDDEGNLNVSPRVNLPFQVVERVNETRATRAVRESKVATLFDVWEGADEGDSFNDGWRNKLIWGDNKLAMESLLEQFAGKIDLIYIDPPFDVGADFSVKVEIGDGEVQLKEPSMIEQVAYRDTWGKGSNSYLSMLYDRLTSIKLLLKPSGSLLLHCDYRVSSPIRLMLDEIFGSESFRNEIIWNKGFRGTEAKRVFQRSHDTIFWYSMSSEYVWNDPKQPYKDEGASRYNQVDEEGNRYALIKRKRGDGSVYYGKTYFKEDGKNANDVISHIATMAATSSERVGYDTQKPLELIEFLVSSLSNEGDLVADFFCGSGTTLIASEKLGRRWIGSDLGRYAIHTTRKRMLEIAECKPFDMLNLGKYERQFWSNVEFGDDLDGDGRIDLLEYISFILKLYGATPLTGSQFLHGKCQKAFVHVGSVSSPITISEVEDALGECVGMSGKELHILGWEWEMGLIDTLTDYAKSKGVKLVARQIPREVMEAEAARKEQVSFYELAYLNASFKEDKNPLSRSCELTDFMIPNPELIPDEVREKITKFSDYVDYWAVDWDFQNDTFMPGWMDYRTKQDRSLKLQTDTHTFAAPGTYKVMIKVVDIFGNDTSKVVEVKVS
jgi:adenine-specific DNA-methyltransferase